MKYLIYLISLVGILHYYDHNSYMFGVCSGIFITTMIMILKEVKHGKKE